MKTIKDYEAEGVPYVINSMGEKRTTREGSIIFSNGWVASVVNPTDNPEQHSVATCDYNGYFDWEILSRYFITDHGTVICNNEKEVCVVLECIKNL